MAISRPQTIWICRSEQDFQERKFEQISILEAEKIIAAHRRIPSFSWMEYDMADEATIQQHAVNLIPPDHLAMCYFGDDIGYVIVAMQPLKASQQLIFAGEYMEKFPEEDHNNVYLAYYQDNEMSFACDAKPRGGFSSMLMDAADAIMITKFHRASGKSVALLEQSFDVAFLNVDAKKKLACLTLKRDMQPYELLAIAYHPSSRLHYKKFIGFNRDGFRLNEKDNAVLNDVLMKPLKQRDTFPWHILLKKIMQDLTTHSITAVIDSLFSMEIPDLEDVLSQLTKRELRLIFNRAASLQYDISNNPFKKAQMKDLISKIETEIWRKDNRLLLERELVDAVHHSNQQQILHRGTGRYQLIANMNGVNTYVVYPNSHADFQHIGKLHKTIGRRDIAAAYFRSSIFHANKNQACDEKNSELRASSQPM